jgi:acetyl-CoA C-acetyltransferase
MGMVSPVGEQGSVIAKVAALKAGWDFPCAGRAAQPLLRLGPGGREHGGAEGALGLGRPGGGRRRGEHEPRAHRLGRRRLGAWTPRPTAPPAFVPQGIGADLIATLEGFTRDDVDAFALESQKRATAARAAGRFAGSVVPVHDFLGQTMLDEDEFIKPRTTLEGLAGSSPRSSRWAPWASTRWRCSVPAGGAHPPRAPRRQFVGHRRRRGAVLIGNEAAARPTTSSRAPASWPPRLSGADPTIMLTGPMPAARKALAKAGMTIDQIDLFEVNEAFAAVPMKFMKEMGVPHEKVNVNGGAIAMGHPLGATGAMILGTLIDELHRRQLRYGLATLCVGGGMGIATIVERI